ncbi:hypothetical protein VQ042_01340 [Aurantimonas sp. A2-1-M11]|uniref:DUF6950 family protein n=1 Tax=Aurantimonas sp. A2-1-M11 TaxID=3113712 RepID=UPI002F94E468
MDDLTQFLRRAAETPFDWASTDCLSWLGEWVAVRHGINPHARYRDRYATRTGAYRLIAEHGSRQGLIDAAVAPLGLLRTDTPQRGDIALVDAPEGELGAIVTGTFTACLEQRGLRFRRRADAPILAAWRV